MQFEDVVYGSYPTGSRYICNPPPMDTDNDTVFLVNGYYDWQQMLLDEGWEDCGEEYEKGSDFHAYRKGEENYIVTEDEDFYQSYIKATEGAKALNLLNKEDRIKLFIAINGAGKRVLNPVRGKYVIWCGGEALSGMRTKWDRCIAREDILLAVPSRSIRTKS